MWQKIWQTWKRQQEKQKRVMHVTFSGEGLTELEELANKMDANPDIVLNCAFTMLKWIVHHIQDGDELTLQKGNEEEYSLVFCYENKRGQKVTIPSSQDIEGGNEKSSKTLQLSDDDERFLRNIGIEPN